MPNRKNLRPIRLSHDEATKNGKLGGVRSGEARRERRKLRDELDYILGMDNGGETMAHSIAMALVEKAMAGDVHAFRAIRDTVDGKPVETGRLELVRTPDFSALDAAFEAMRIDE